MNMSLEISKDTLDYDIRRWLLLVGYYLMITFVLSLRGNEGFMMDAGALARHINCGKGDREENPHAVIPLLGRFKGEDGGRLHLMLVSPYTDSGFEVRKWTEAVITLLSGDGNLSGPVMCDKEGMMMASSEVDA